MPNPSPSHPVQLSDDQKLLLLNQQRMSAGEPAWTNLDETRWCLHCTKVFTGHSVRVYPSFRMPGGYSLGCGTPRCDGTPIDWDMPESDFARGVTAQYTQDDLGRVRDKPLPGPHESSPED